MSIIEQSTLIAAPAEQVFDFTQDYGKRKLWDGFAKRYFIEDDGAFAKPGSKSSVTAYNGLCMTVQLVSVNRPRVASMKMLDGPWFFQSFAGSWVFRPVSENQTWGRFKYNYRLRHRPLSWLLAPIVFYELNRKMRDRVVALKENLEKGDSNSFGRDR